MTIDRSNGARRSLAVVTLAALALLAGCSGSADGKDADGDAGKSKKEDAIAVEIAPARRASLSSLYSTSATLRAEKSATLTARTRGVIRRLLVEEGRQVPEGEPVAMLENDEQRIAVDRAVTTRDTKTRELQRAVSLHEQSLLSDEAFETTRREAEDATHAADLAELQLSRTVIRAPFAGTIVKRYLDVGATVSDGTPVFDVADVDPLYADVGVPERHVARLTPGQFVRLTSDAESAEVDGRIERVAPAVDSNNGTVKVTLAVAGASGFRPGAFVRVDFVTDTHADALVVPRSALVAEGRRWHVFKLVDGGDKVAQVEVDLGFEEGDRVEIFVKDASAPIDDGIGVVVVGASALTDASRVRVVPPEAPEAEDAKRVGA